MKKRIAVIFVLILLTVALFAGCAKSSAPDTTLDAILTEIEATVALDSASRLSDADLLDLYGIKAADIAEQASLTSMNGIFPDEAILIQAVDADALTRIKGKLDSRLAEVLNQSKSYDAVSYAIAQKCTVDVRGLYIALFVSANHEKMTEIYNAHF